MNETTKLVDHLAVQSDRYLFIATLIVLGFFAYIVMRYFLKQYESLINDHKEARSQQDSTTREVVKALTANTEIIRQNSECLKDCAEAMRDHRHP